MDAPQAPGPAGEIAAGRHDARALAFYAAFALPLAMAALPLYLHLPKFYGDLGMPLALVGAVLLVARALDALQDPLLGWWCDRRQARRGFVLASLPLLAAGMLGLFHPPAGEQARLAAMALWLLVVHLGFSMGSIAYQAWGAQLAFSTHDRTRVTASREAATLAGVILASVLPAALAAAPADQLPRFSWVFVLLLALGGLLTLAFTPAPPRRQPVRVPLRGMFAPLAVARFRRLLAVFVASGVAAAIPSTLVLFFVADVIGAESWVPAFLGAYFLAGALAMPLWVAAARHVGKERAWLGAMGIAVGAFVWAYALGPGDTFAFLIICVLSGVALGADLALPPSLLADVIDHRGDTGREGAYFGLWNLAAKANLALAAGIALPLVSVLGYEPGAASDEAARRSLAAMYCLAPCVLKLVSAALLWRWLPLAGEDFSQAGRFPERPPACSPDRSPSC